MCPDHREYWSSALTSTRQDSWSGADGGAVRPDEDQGYLLDNRQTEAGIRFRSGRDLDADIIITATGLQLLFFGGIEVAVDGRDVDPAEAVAYKAMMLSGVPNLSFSVGYTNASWTLKCDLVSKYVCRLLNHMDANGHAYCTPQPPGPEVELSPVIDLEAGYVLRSLDELPKQGARAPWRLRQNYPYDVATLRWGSIEAGMEFSPAPATAPAPAATA